MQTDSPASEILSLVRDRTGPVTGIRRTTHGHSSDLTAIVECAEGPFFVKAVRNRPGGRRDSLIRERETGAALVPVAPPLLWDVEAEEWLTVMVRAYEAWTSHRGVGVPPAPAGV